MIRKVALVGKGYVGAKIYDALVNAGFEVTILTRASGAAAADPESNHPRTRAVDYSSTKSLVEALLGQDAVVSALAPAAWEHHFKLLDAAIDAKVKHFIPSDYTSLSTFPEVADLPYWKELATVQQYLRDKAGSAGVKWTVLAAGPLLECVLNGHYMCNFGERTALMIGDGDLQVSMTTGPYLGEAVAKVLSKSEELESGPIYLHEAVTTQNELLKMAEKLSDKEWPVQHVEADDTLQKGLDMVKASQGGKPPVFSLLLIIQGTIFSGKYNVEWDGSGNKLLDLPTMSKDKLEGLVETRVKGDVL